MPKAIKTKAPAKEKSVKTNKSNNNLTCSLWSACGFIKTHKLLASLVVVVILLLALVIIYWPGQKNNNDEMISADPANEANKELVGISNPASLNCLELGGNLEMKKGHDGGEYGVCLFSNGFQCEEWAMLHGDCPVGGLDVTEYVRDWDYYCAVTGGQVLPGDNCKVSDDITCNTEDYYLGRCHK